MTGSVKVEKITGQSDEKFATSIFSKRVSVGEDVGNLVFVILVKNPMGEDLQASFADILDIFSTTLEKAENEHLEALKKAGESAKSYIESKSLEASFASCFFIKKTCYVVRFGDKVKVFVYKFQKSKELSFEAGSGPVKGGEIFVLATEKFFSSFNTASLSETEEVDLEEIIDGIATEISADKDQSQIGAAFAQTGDKTSHVEKGEEKVGEQPTQEEKKEIKALETSSESSTGDEIVASQEKKRMVGSLFASVFHKIAGEASRLKRGDIAAIIRVRRNIAIIGVLILLVITISAVFTLKGQRDKENLARFEASFSQASSKYDEGVAILPLNKQRARENFVEADDKVKVALSILPDNNDAKKLAGDIAARLKEVETLTNISFKEVTDKIKGGVALSQTQDNLLVFATTSAFEVSPDGKLIDEYKINNLLDGTFYNKAIIYLSGDKIVKKDLIKDEEIDVGESPNARDLGVFIGNIYVLSADQIFKFVPTEGGYVRSKDYLENGEQFSGDSRFAIDGSVWVTAGDKINKYTRGIKEEFSISGLSAGAKFGEIYTNSDLDNLYVLDRTNSTLFVISKEGLFVNSYQSPELKDTKGLVVDSAGETLYIVSSGKLLSAKIGQ